jgi:hypothetical protein
LPTDCRFAQDQTGVLAVFSLYYQRKIEAGQQFNLSPEQRKRLLVRERL